MSIKLHLTAAVVLLPLLVLLMADELIFALAGLLYFAGLIFVARSTTAGRRFVRRYYREMLRLEREMSL